jgi:hypothetical protein
MSHDGKDPQLTFHVLTSALDSTDTGRKVMNPEFTTNLRSLSSPLPTTVGLTPVNVLEASTPRGEWTVPAVEEISLALAVLDYSASWHVNIMMHHQMSAYRLYL